jgi:hypothetical protein
MASGPVRLLLPKPLKWRAYLWVPGVNLLCYNAAWIKHAVKAMHHFRPAETTLNWSATRRLAVAGLGLLLLWVAVWWAIQ